MISIKPAVDLAPLLDELGIAKTWKHLLLTLVESARPELLEFLLKSEEYVDVTPKEWDVPNLLENLTIGEISVLYEYSLAYIDHRSRKDNGQYFTPDDVSQLMSRLSKRIGKHGVWLDPCCGVGNLSYWLVESQNDPEEFLIKQMRFNDLDPLALLICRTLMTFWFQKRKKNLFKKLRDNYTNMDFLDKDFTKKVSYSYVIVNPPYANTGKKEGFITSNIHDLWAYFMEQCIKTANGFISITPQTFTNAGKYSTLRELLLKNAKQLNIFCFDNIPDAIFRGYKFGSQNTNTSNSVRAAITVWKRDADHGENKNRFSITPLLRWPSAMRTTMFHSVERFENKSVDFTVKSFPKNWAETSRLYEKLILRDRLSTWLSKEITDHILYVPSTPRYYISATKRKLNRSSYHTLYFNTSEERDKAYILLNSSVAYWWWRLMDGGMTLSAKTLRDLPISSRLSKMETKLIQPYVQKLEQSEEDNLVVKVNAGKDNENVKHHHHLIRELTSIVVKQPEIIEFLSQIHTNNDLLYNDLS